MSFLDGRTLSAGIVYEKVRISVAGGMSSDSFCRCTAQGLRMAHPQSERVGIDALRWWRHWHECMGGTG